MLMVGNYKQCQVHTNANIESHASGEGNFHRQVKQQNCILISHTVQIYLIEISAPQIGKKVQIER